MQVNHKQLEDIAEAQHGYFTARQAKSCGFSDELHVYHCKVGNWRRMSPGLFRLNGFKDTQISDFVRWSLWSRNKDDQPQAAISFHSALAAHGLAEEYPEETHVTVPKSFRKKVPDGCVVHKASLNLSTIEHREGFLLTRPGQTLCDMRPHLENAGTWQTTLKKAIGSGAIGNKDNVRYELNAEIPKNLSDTEKSDNHRTTTNNTNKLNPEKVDNYQSPSDTTANGVWQMIFERTEASRRKARAGFTLVELLVVIAIISVLAAMLMPALGKAMASARSISCQNNLKQLYLATAMYAGDYNNYIPAAAMGSGGPGISTNWYDIRWAMQLPPYLGGNKPATQPWYTTTECQKCPAFYSFYPDADRTVSAANTYAIAHWFSTYNMTLPWPKMNSPRYPHPANTPLYVDGAQSDTQPYMSYWHVDHEGVNRIGLHHGGKTNVLFFDSHVKPIHASSLDNWNWSSYNAP